MDKIYLQIESWWKGTQIETCHQCGGQYQSRRSGDIPEDDKYCSMSCLMSSGKWKRLGKEHHSL